jgi:CBS domain-containing protein
MMRVEEVLRGKGTRIITVDMNETVAVAIELLNREGIGALVVKDVVHTEGNTVVGMFSERDVVRALAAHAAAALKMRVAAFMSMKVIACGPRDALDDVRQLMSANNIRHVPVLDDFTLIGIISVRDLIGVLEADPAAAPTLFASSGRAGTHERARAPLA